MKRDHEQIARMIPHAGAMCLLDEVREWGPSHVSCTALAPGAGHPLLRDALVPAVMAVEYAAQACAVHGALLGAAEPGQAGLLATLVDVDLHTEGIAQDRGPIAVEVRMLGRTANGCLYGFEVALADRAIVAGRLVVALAPGEAR